MEKHAGRKASVANDPRPRHLPLRQRPREAPRPGRADPSHKWTLVIPSDKRGEENAYARVDARLKALTQEVTDFCGGQRFQKGQIEF